MDAIEIAETTSSVTVGRYPIFVKVFLAFAVAITAGNVYAEVFSPNLELGRVTASIVACAALAIPAIWFFFSRTPATAPAAILWEWKLWWSFALMTYVLHVYLSMTFFDSSLSQVIRRQGIVVTAVNFTLLGAWIVDVVLAWTKPRSAYWLRWTTHILFVAAFFVAAVVFGMNRSTPASMVIAFVLAALTLLGLFVRR